MFTMSVTNLALPPRSPAFSCEACWLRPWPSLQTRSGSEKPRRLCETSDPEIPVVLTSRRRRLVNSSVHVARRDVLTPETHRDHYDRQRHALHAVGVAQPSVCRLPTVAVRHQHRRSNETCTRRTTVRRPQQRRYLRDPMLAVFIQHRSVTDRHTDTRQRHIPRLA